MSDAITLKGELLFPSKYVGAADLKGRDVIVEIESIDISELQMVGGRKEKKPLVHFKKTPKALVLNKTNARTIASLYGGAVEGWVGKRIVLFPTTTTCGRNTVDCVRIRDVVPGMPRPDPAPSFEDIPDGMISAEIPAGV